MKNKRRGYLKYLIIIVSMISVIMFGWLYMDQIVNKEFANVTVSVVDIQADYVIQSSDRGLKFEIRRVHKDAIPKDNLISLDKIHNYETATIIPSGTIISEKLLRLKGSQNNIDGKIDFPLVVSITRIANGILKIGDNVIIYGTKPIKNNSNISDTWLGALTNNALVVGVQGDLEKESMATVTFRIDSLIVSTLVSLSQEGTLYFAKGTYAEAAQLGSNVLQNLVGLSSGINGSIEFIGENKPELNKLVLVDKGFNFEFRYYVPMLITIDHYNLDGELGNYNGLYLLNSSIENKKITYNPISGIYSFPKKQNSKYSFDEAGYYKISLIDQVTQKNSNGDLETITLKQEYMYFVEIEKSEFKYELGFFYEDNFEKSIFKSTNLFSYYFDSTLDKLLDSQADIMFFKESFNGINDLKNININNISDNYKFYAKKVEVYNDYFKMQIKWNFLEDIFKDKNILDSKATNLQIVELLNKIAIISPSLSSKISQYIAQINNENEDEFLAYLKNLKSYQISQIINYLNDIDITDHITSEYFGLLLFREFKGSIDTTNKMILASLINDSLNPYKLKITYVNLNGDEVVADVRIKILYNGFATE